jgi:hypothetical protein
MTTVPHASESETKRDPLSVPQVVRFYVFALVVLIPMDWFAPTGLALREFGAKPATMLLTAGGLLGLLFRPRQTMTGDQIRIALFFVAFLLLGFLAAVMNFSLDWSSWSYFRDPATQLLTQSLLIVTAGIALLGNYRLALAYPMADLTCKYLTAACVFHMTLLVSEAIGLLDDGAFPLVLFRASEPWAIERPTGLFSEPSYYGVFAALYGTALFFLPTDSRAKRFANAIVALLLYAIAVLIGAKTFVVVAGTQALYVISRQARTGGARLAALALLLAVAGCALFFMQYYSALDVEQNLSSANRLGSALLAMRVALDGYGLAGIGIGQFHFFYRDSFAPRFLYLSWEALLQLSPEAPNRASTYNFYLRVIVEVGILGFAMLAWALRSLWLTRTAGALQPVALIFVGSLGFLMTQDTYFYPPLLFSAALLLASRSNGYQMWSVTRTGDPARELSDA